RIPRSGGGCSRVSVAPSSRVWPRRDRIRRHRRRVCPGSISSAGVAGATLPGGGLRGGRRGPFRQTSRVWPRRDPIRRHGLRVCPGSMSSAGVAGAPLPGGGLGGGRRGPFRLMTEARVLSVLIPAVGGQGGGVLAEWLVDAGLIAGHAAHGTSIPGVAQRPGSTTYYVEIYAGDPHEPPVFSLYPLPGAPHVPLAPEFLAVGRALELGFPSPERTTIVASTHRLFSIHEKMATGRAIHPPGELETAARAFSRALVAFDALAVAREHASEVNAVLLGALAASDALPVRP